MVGVAYTLFNYFLLTCVVSAGGGLTAYFGGREKFREVVEIEAKFGAAVDRLEKMVGALSKADGRAVSKESDSSGALSKADGRAVSKESGSSGVLSKADGRAVSKESGSSGALSKADGRAVSKESGSLLGAGVATK